MKLTWDEIKNKYADQWVELIDYEWDEFESKPRSGIVRDYSKTRKELHQRFMQSPNENSAIVYTGSVQFDQNSVFRANLHQCTNLSEKKI